MRLLLFFSFGTLLTIVGLTFFLAIGFWVWVLGLPLAALGCWIYEQGRKRAWWEG